jgi:uncharacterized glyoxalase superfamily protein PhnB
MFRRIGAIAARRVVTRAELKEIDSSLFEFSDTVPEEMLHWFEEQPVLIKETCKERLLQFLRGCMAAGKKVGFAAR